MTRPNRDTIVAVFLLLGCGVLLRASFDIREPDYGQLSPATWPRVVIAVLALLSFIYLIQSIKAGPSLSSPRALDERAPGAGGVFGFISYWRNVLWCFALYFAYLWTLPQLGMLVGGVSFVFFLLNALGGWQPRLLLLHAVIALISVGGMWSLFTYGLGVILPGGELFAGL